MTYTDAIDAVVAAFGTVRGVFHDRRDGDAHVDLYLIDTIVDRQPRLLLLTVGCGLVDRYDAESIELAMLLPANWPVTEDQLGRPEVFWPFAWLRFLGARIPRLPVALVPGALLSIPFDPGHPAPTRFEAAIGVPGEWLIPELADAIVHRPDGKEVFVTGLVPLEAGELEWAAGQGQDPTDGTVLLDRLEQRVASSQVSLVVDERRPTFVPN